MLTATSTRSRPHNYSELVLRINLVYQKPSNGLVDVLAKSIQVTFRSRLGHVEAGTYPFECRYQPVHRYSPGMRARIVDL